MSEKYTIGELAKQLNVTTRTIRYYDQKGLLKPSGVNENGYRLLNKLPLKTRYFNPVMKTSPFIVFFLKSIFPSFPLL